MGKDLLYIKINLWVFSILLYRQVRNFISVVSVIGSLHASAFVKFVNGLAGLSFLGIFSKPFISVGILVAVGVI